MVNSGDAGEKIINLMTRRASHDYLSPEPHGRAAAHGGPDGGRPT
jgi:hypothetical protein